MKSAYSQKQLDLHQWSKDYSKALYDWAFYKTGDKEIAEDLVQDCFAAAVEAYDRFAGRSKAKTWLFAILNRKIADHYRSKERKVYRHEDPYEAQAQQRIDQKFNAQGGWEEAHPSSEDWEDLHLLDREDFRAVLALCLDDLPLRWRTAITGKYLQEKTAEELRQELELSASNYWQIIHRAKLMLRDCFKLNWNPS